MKTMTRQELQAGLEMVAAIGQGIRDLCEARRQRGEDPTVPSGEMYAHLMAAGMSLDSYNAVIRMLQNARLIEVNNHLIRWIGPETEAK